MAKMGTGYHAGGAKRPASIRGWSTGVVGVCIGSGGLGVAGVFAAPKTGTGWTYALFLLLCLGSIAFGIATERGPNGGIDLVSPFILIPFMFAVVYGVGAQQYVRDTWSGLESFLTLLLVVSLGAYLFGVISVRVVMGKARLRWGRDEGASAVWRRAGMPTLFFAVGILAMLFYWAKAGGIPLLSGDLETSRIDSLSGSGVPFYLSMLVMPAVWLRLAMREGKLSTRDYLYVAAAAGILASTGWRNTTVALVIVALIIRHIKRPFRGRTLIVAGLLVVTGAAAVGLYRVYSSSVTSYETYRLLSSGDYGRALITYLVTYPQSFTVNLAQVVGGWRAAFDNLHGLSLVWNLQLLMPGHTAKPFDFVLKQGLGVGFVGGGLPPTLVGEMFLNFGTIGSAVGMFIFGAVYQAVHGILTSNQRSDPKILCVCVIGLYYMSVAVRGGVGDVLLTLIWLALVTFVLTSLAVGREVSAVGSRRDLVRGIDASYQRP